MINISALINVYLAFRTSLALACRRKKHSKRSTGPLPSAGFPYRPPSKILRELAHTQAFAHFRVPLWPTKHVVHPRESSREEWDNSRAHHPEKAAHLVILAFTWTSRQGVMVPPTADAHHQKARVAIARTRYLPAPRLQTLLCPKRALLRRWSSPQHCSARKQSL